MSSPGAFVRPAFLIALALLAGALGGFRFPRRLPPLLFASRQPVSSNDPGTVAGFGPVGRVQVPGGGLFVRDPDGTVRPFPLETKFFDVCDPSVSFDGSRVVFAATVSPDSAFRLYRADASGGNLGTVTRTGGARERFDDIDPGWLPDGRIVFSSTRFAMKDQIRGGPVTNLFVVHEDGSGLARITTDRNGAEEPAIDPSTGRVVYSRWWFNPYRPSDASGVTTDTGSAVPGERVNLWQAVSVAPDGDGVRLAAGNPLNRAEQMLYQIAVLPSGTVVGINAAEPALFPRAGGTRLVAFDEGIGPMRVLRPSGRVASPVGIDDRTIVVSEASPGRGDLDLHILDLASGDVSLLLDRPGTDELDAVPLVARKVPPVPGAMLPPPMSVQPLAEESTLHNGIETFRFDCLNVFANGPVDAPIPNAPAAEPDVRIRFYAVLSRPESAAGDTLVLVREAPVTPEGAVHEHDLPADVPMFEQLVDRNGKILRTSRGAAHVPGFNFARLGSGTKCIGCHTGHSTLVVPINYDRAGWFNAAPSAHAEVSSAASGTVPEALVDRRARGPVEDVGWISQSGDSAWARLSWSFPIEVKAIIVYAADPAPRGRADRSIDELEVILLREDREVGRSAFRSRVDPKGSHIEISPTVVDAVELRPRGASGSIGGEPAAALSEIEIIARLVW